MVDMRLWRGVDESQGGLGQNKLVIHVLCGRFGYEVLTMSMVAIVSTKLIGARLRTSS